MADQNAASDAALSPQDREMDDVSEQAYPRLDDPDPKAGMVDCEASMGHNYKDNPLKVCFI